MLVPLHFRPSPRVDLHGLHLGLRTCRMRKWLLFSTNLRRQKAYVLVKLCLSACACKQPILFFCMWNGYTHLHFTEFGNSHYSRISMLFLFLACVAWSRFGSGTRIYTTGVGGVAVFPVSYTKTEEANFSPCVRRDHGVLWNVGT